MLMGLSAGRIWWLSRGARQIWGKKMVGTYYTACAMILESGALYCVGAIVCFVLGFTGSFSKGLPMGAVLGQLVGIAPTIIAVRVGLRKSVESIDSFVEMPQPRVRVGREVPPAVYSPALIEQRVLHIRPESDNASTKAQMVS
ncbi:hypothetical protein K438DRAFT_1978662 [Mycena galopus ATCC 62051]|nr:hypothetical protein K438DRAFT_1978662 [Mycena galopus ATCC 62051]